MANLGRCIKHLLLLPPLEDLVAWGFVAIVAHVVPVVGRGRAKAEDVAEDADDSEQALHLSFEAAGETEEFVSVGGGHLG